MFRLGNLKYLFPLLSILSPAQPAHRWRSSNSGDLDKLYDSATPNPTGSLSGPWFDMTEAEREVTGVTGKATHLVCRIKNLGNHTVGRNVSLDFLLCCVPFPTHRQIIC